MQDQYLSATFSVNLSPTQSHNMKILFKCNIWIGSQTRITTVWNRGFTNTLNRSSKPLWQISKVTFTKTYWLVLEATLKSKEPFTLSYIFSLPMQPCHIPNPSGHWLTIYSVRMSPPLFVTLAVFLLKFTYIYVMPIFFSRNTSLVATKTHALHTTWNGLTDRANKYMNKEGNSH